MENEKGRLYTIGDVCEKVKSKGFKEFYSHNLRYIEKVVELEIRRDEYSNRVYNDKDIELIVTVLNLKNQGLNYSAIKNVLKNSDQVEVKYNNEVEISDTDTDTDLDIVDENPNIAMLQAAIQDIMCKSIEQTIIPRINELKSEISELKTNNSELIRIIESQNKEHFKVLDEKLVKWRDESTKKKGFLNGLFQGRK